jgi:hypothetical protein
MKKVLVLQTARQKALVTNKQERMAFSFYLINSPTGTCLIHRPFNNAMATIQIMQHE